MEIDHAQEVCEVIKSSFEQIAEAIKKQDTELKTLMDAIRNLQDDNVLLLQRMADLERNQHIDPLNNPCIDQPMFPTISEAFGDHENV